MFNNSLAMAYGACQPNILTTMTALQRNALDTLSSGGTVKILNYTDARNGRPPNLAFRAPDALSKELIPRYILFRKDPCRDLWIESTDECRNPHPVVHTESNLSARIRSRMTFPSAHTIVLTNADNSVRSAYRKAEIDFTN